MVGCGVFIAIVMADSPGTLLVADMLVNGRVALMGSERSKSSSVNNVCSVL
jgi:hypothetical protein